MKNFFGRVFSTILGNFLTVALIVGSFLVLALIGSAGSWFSSKDKIRDGSVIEISLNNAILESGMEAESNPFDFGNNKQTYYLKDYLRAIELAKEDDKIKGISLKLNSFKGGITQLEDFRKALESFKESGKFIYSYSNGLSQGAYYLASVADSMFHNPMGEVNFKGLGSEVMFFKNFGDKYGVDFQVIRHGEYKSAVEPFLRDNLSDENRLQISELLNDIWSGMVNNIAKSRGMSTTEVNTIADSLYAMHAEKSVEIKLFDKIVHESEYDQLIAKKIELELEEDDKFYTEYKKKIVGLDKFLKNNKNKSKKDKVAILYASGTITSGSGSEGIQSETYKKAIRKLRDNEKVKAVVLRINSGGGSANASEEILYEMKLLREKKPVIVSFGDVAASGGYYIALESDSIFAQPSTITGSIGVLGMIPSVKQMINNVGVTTDYVQTNANSTAFSSPFQPLSETAEREVTNAVEQVYEKFVNHVGKARNMSFAEVDSIARGRVWTGNQAKKIGLIDDFGNLNDAIKAAAAKAKLEEGEYSTINRPIKKDDLEEFLSKYQVQSVNHVIKEELGEEHYKVYQQIKTIKNQNGIQMRMPFDLNIN